MASQAKAPTRDDLEHVPLPGLGEDFMQDSDYPIAEDWYASAMTVRERTMLSLMLALKDKPEWDRKVFDEELNKLVHLEPAASEANVTRNYLDWLTQVCILSFFI